MEGRRERKERSNTSIGCMVFFTRNAILAKLIFFFTNQSLSAMGTFGILPLLSHSSFFSTRIPPILYSFPFLAIPLPFLTLLCAACFLIAWGFGLIPLSFRFFSHKPLVRAANFAVIACGALLYLVSAAVPTVRAQAQTQYVPLSPLPLSSSHLL